MDDLHWRRVILKIVLSLHILVWTNFRANAGKYEAAKNQIGNCTYSEKFFQTNWWGRCICKKIMVSIKYLLLEGPCLIRSFHKADLDDTISLPSIFEFWITSISFERGGAMKSKAHFLCIIFICIHPKYYFIANMNIIMFQTYHNSLLFSCKMIHSSLFIFYVFFRLFIFFKYLL